jgi:hypothetical protein
MVIEMDEAPPALRLGVARGDAAASIGGKVKKRAIPETHWFEERTSAFRGRWNEVPWHKSGDARLKSLDGGIRKNARLINELPRGFLPSAFDQYLAVLSEGYRYDCFTVTEELGGNRYACISESGEEFALYSPSLGSAIRLGESLFLTSLVPLEREGEGSGCFLTYGPILGWHGLLKGDMDFLAGMVARNLFTAKGLSEVIRFNPVPFWAAWSWGEAPLVVHQGQALARCWSEGALSAEIAEKLSGSWRREDAGTKTRWAYKDDHPMRQRFIFRDKKSGRGLVLAMRPADFNFAMRAASRYFSPDEDPQTASMLMEIIAKETLGRGVNFASWERPFARKGGESQDNEASDEKTHGILEALNAAMPDVVSAINEGREPEWIKIGERYRLNAEALDNLKRIAENVRNMQ